MNVIQGFYSLLKVPKFNGGNFKALKVVENDPVLENRMEPKKQKE